MSFAFPSLLTAADTRVLAFNPLLTLADIERTLGYPITPAHLVPARARELADRGLLPKPHRFEHGAPRWFSSALYERFANRTDPLPRPRPLTAHDRFCTQSPDGLRQASITVTAACPLATYQCYLQQVGFPLPASPGGALDVLDTPNPEHLVRLRRVVSFADVTGLVPIWLADFPPLASLVGLFSEVDHPTMWEGALGCHYLLIELCHDLTRDFRRFSQWGLDIVEVPEPLAPYGERWNPAAGAKPGTRSYLVTAEDAGDRLSAIEERLLSAAAQAPAWNDTVGVKS